MTPTWRGRTARALHRALLLLAPRETRRRYRAEMIETFEALSRTADAEGVRATARLVTREARDMIKAHRRERPTIFPAERIAPMPAGPSSFSLRPSSASPLWRSLARRPMFTATIVLTLAIGTGITTTLFAVVDAVLLRPLPYPDPDRLVTVLESSPTAPGQGTMAAPGRIEDWHRLNQTFAAIAASYSDSFTDTSVPEPERLPGRRVTPRYFTVFGAPAALGRTFTDVEELADGPPAAVISDAFWRRRFARDPKAIGYALKIGGTSYPIVGVMAPTFAQDSTDVWLPARMAPFMLTLRDARFVWGVGRMKPGVTVAQARADLDRVQGTLGQTFPATDKGWSAVILDLKQARIGDRGLAIWLAFGAVVLVWLISIANVAALVLADTYRRARELAIRSALGASRPRVAGVVVQEVLVLTIAGGALGLVIANSLLALVPRIFETLPRQSELAIDWRGFLFASLTSLAAGVLCGVVPALQATARGVAPVLARAGRGTTGGAHRLQRWLVGVQVALGVVLCSSAAFLATSYHRLASVDPGFKPEGLMTFRVAARWDEDRPRIGQVQVDLVSALERQPGVSAAGFVSFLPAPGGSLRYQVTIDGLAVENGAAPVGFRTVSAGYLRAIGVPLKGGESCAPLRVDFNMQRTVMVNQAFVDRYAQGQNLVGRQVRMTDRPRSPLTIVGVIANISEDGPRVAPFPFLYGCDSAGSWPDPNYVVRASDAASLIANLRAIVRQVDPTRAVFGVRVLEDVLDSAVAEPRVNASLMGGFAIAALLVGAIGLYALFARLVAESRREIGVRLALGAEPASIVGLIVADAGRLLIAGALAGVALSAAAFQFLRATLFNVGASDTAVVAGVTTVLLAVAGMAVVIPAVRASKVAPTEALRTDG